MPALAIFIAVVLAVVVATGAVLDRLKVRHSRRVLVWSGLFLLPVVVFVLLAVFVLLMLMLNPMKGFC